jgi:hypothetical protein
VSTPLTTVERIAALALPREAREFVVADLYEESAGAGRRSGRWRAIQMLRIGGRYHTECYRDLDDRLRIASLATIVLGVLWMVTAATNTTFANGETYFSDPIARAMIRFWSASHITSALAAGLAAGRIRLVAEHAAESRWHVAMGGAVVCIAWHGGAAGVVAAVCLLAATWLGDLTRKGLVRSNQEANA